MLFSSLKFEKIESSQDLDQLSDLLNHFFSAPFGGQRFYDDFPIWDPKFKSSSEIYRMGGFDQSELISCALLRTTQIQIDAFEKIKIGIIGGVVTNQNFRDQGIASKMVSKLLDQAKSQDVSMVILWGSESSLYKKLGFNPFGKQLRINLSDFNLILQHDHSLNFKNLNKGFNFQIFNERLNKKTGLHLMRNDLEWYKSHKNVQWFYMGNADRVTAYAGYERGIDLKGIVHEWGGQIEDLKKIFQYIFSQFNSAQLICSPSDLNFFKINSFSFIEENLCLAKVLDDKYSLKLLESLWIWGLDSA